MLTKQRAHKLYLAAVAVLILYVVITGIYRGGTWHFAALRTFTYQSNIFMAAGFAVLLLTGRAALRSYVISSVLIAITVTGLVYNFVLVPLGGAPVVWSDYRNFSLHLLTCVLALANYGIFEPKGHLSYRHILVGMIFPALYWLVFVSIGGIIDFYPYFFMNPNIVGLPMLFVWFGALLAVFAVLGAVLVWVDNRGPA